MESCTDVIACGFPRGVALAIAASAMFSLTARAEPQIINIGVVPGGAWSAARGISADGTTVVGKGGYSLTGPTRAFQWKQQTGVIDLSSSSGFTSDEALAVSEHGEFVVGSAYFVGLGVRATRWSDALGMQNLGTLPGGTLSRGSGVSADGSVVVGYGPSQSGWRAFRWTFPTGPLSMGAQPGATDSYCYGVSADGATAGGVSYFGAGSGEYKSFRWRAPNSLLALPFPPGTTAVYVNGMSGDGTTLVGSTNAFGPTRAFRWTEAEGMINIDGAAPPERNRSEAWCTSYDGTKIVGTLDLNRPFVWTASDGLHELAPLLTAKGANLAGWSLTEARAISADGSAIAGTGLFHGEQRAFVVSGLLWIDACGTADVGSAGSASGADGHLDNNDFIVFISLFFAQSPAADRGRAGGLSGADGSFDNNDFIVFINDFFAGC